MSTPKRSLRQVLLLAFALQSLGMFAVVGWLNWSSGQQAVAQLSGRLSGQLSAAVEARLRIYVEEPQQLLESWAEALEDGALPPDDADRLAQAFHGAVRSDPQVGYLSYGSLDGHFVGAQRLDDGRLRWRIQDEQTGGLLLDFEGLPRLPRPEPVSTRAGYDPVARPWFVQAVKAGGTTWTDIYPSATSPGATLVTVVRPIRRPDGGLLGVMGVDIILSQASQFLEELTRAQEALVFVADREGRLVATSYGEVVVDPRAEDAHRLLASESRDPAVRAVAEALGAQRGGFAGLGAREELRVPVGDDAVLVELLPLEGGPGLSWVIGVLIPERGLLAHFQRLTRGTLTLSLFALGVAILLAWSISNRITRPLRALTEKAERIREGDLQQRFEADRDDEIGHLSRAMGEMVEGLEARDRLKDAFGRYVTPELAESFARDPQQLKLGGALTEVTILMSDLRGFTGLSERLEPEEMIGLLNRYLGAMTEVILEHGGTIIEFIGDAILVVFGAPFRRPDDAARAVRCALEMQRTLEQFNAEGGSSGQPWLDMGIGVHSGPVVAGNIGSERATKYGVVGEAVNLTARLESLTVAGQVFLSATTRARIGDDFDLIGPTEIRLKGVSAPVALFELRGALRPEPRPLPPRRLAPRSPMSLPAELLFIDGRQLLRTPNPVTVLELGLDDVLIRCERPLQRLAKVALRVTLPEGVRTGELYAIVSEQEGERARLTFTSMDPIDTQRVHAALDAAG